MLCKHNVAKITISLTITTPALRNFKIYFGIMAWIGELYMQNGQFFAIFSNTSNFQNGGAYCANVNDGNILLRFLQQIGKNMLYLIKTQRRVTVLIYAVFVENESK